MEEATDTVTYQFECDRELWEAWRETVPRSMPLHARLTDMIEQDHRAASQSDDIEQASVDVMVTRIRIRTIQAISALRDDDDPDSAIEQLQEIKRLADMMES